MHRIREYLFFAMGVMMLAAGSVAAWEKDAPANPPVIPPNPNHLPKVLLIGDSISSGYYPLVAKALEGKAVVAKSCDNGESTAVGVKKIDGWLGDTMWDVIHFNWGVWDMYGWQYASDDRSPAMYAQRLETLVVRMKKTGARLIWATTTPAPPKPEVTMLKRWKKEVVIDQELERQYQEAALQVMKKHDVQVNDLYALLKPRRSEFQSDDDVHLSGAGSALMAGQVADCILKNLGSERHVGEPPTGTAPTEPKKKLADVLGTSHVRPLYHLTDGDILNEGADQVLKLGMKVIKVWFANGDETPSKMYPNNSNWPMAKSLVECALLPYYKTLFSKPFTTYIPNVASIGRDPYYWRHGITQAQQDDETKQFYELSRHLLKTSEGSGKTFVLQHHEGDWHVRGHTRADEDPDPKIFGNMILWLNARQAGVVRARNEIGRNGVQVYHAAEINLVRSSMEEGRPNIVNKVLPHTKLDLVSYSAYDSTVGLHDKPEVFRKALDYIAKHLPDSPHFGNRNVYLGEYGLPESNFPADQVRKVISNTTRTALDWGCPYVVYWQLYCNEPAKNPLQLKLPVKRNQDCRGFWLIRPNGTPSWAYGYFAELLKSESTAGD